VKQYTGAVAQPTTQHRAEPDSDAANYVFLSVKSAQTLEKALQKIKFQQEFYQKSHLNMQYM